MYNYTFVCRWILVPTMTHVYLTHVLVTLVGTVNVSALLWLPMLNPVIKLEFVYNGDLQISAVSNQDETFLVEHLISS